MDVRIEARVAVFAVAGKAAFRTGPVSSLVAGSRDKHLIYIDFISTANALTRGVTIEVALLPAKRGT